MGDANPYDFFSWPLAGAGYMRERNRYPPDNMLVRDVLAAALVASHIVHKPIWLHQMYSNFIYTLMPGVDPCKTFSEHLGRLWHDVDI